MRPGDRAYKSFELANTTTDRRTLDLGTLRFSGLNPGNYAVSRDGCSAARLAWGATCELTVEFTARGTSVEPGYPFTPSQGTYPAQAAIESTGRHAGVKIPLEAEPTKSCGGFGSR